MLRSLLAGRDGPDQRALPAGEFLHPIPLLALLLMVVNDWWLKPSGIAPPGLTGKLSDFAGLLFFPLLLTASLDCLALGVHRLGLDIDFTLRRYKVATAILLTAACFSLVKLSPTFNEAALTALGRVGIEASIVLDASDLIALPVLALSWLLARAEIARVPLGRIELIEARHRRSRVGVGVLLDDTIKAGASPGTIAELTEALDDYLQAGTAESANRVRASLSRLRDLSLRAH